MHTNSHQADASALALSVGQYQPERDRLVTTYGNSGAIKIEYIKPIGTSTSVTFSYKT